MSDYDEFEEEEYSSKIDNKTLKRIIGLAPPAPDLGDRFSDYHRHRIHPGWLFYLFKQEDH